MIRVATSMRTELIPQRDETRDCIDQRWADFLAECGAICIPFPNAPANTEALWNATAPQAVLLSGGNDSVERERTEMILLQKAVLQRVPVLGVCHGMQVMIRHQGGKIGATAGHVRVRHSVQGKYFPHRIVNSFHTEGVLSVPPGFSPLAQSDDGVIEAIAHEKLPWLGLMWHPEREQPFDPADLMLLRRFLKTGEITP